MELVNQIIAAVMLFGIVTAVFAPIIAESGLQIFSKSVSISDAMESSRDRTGQIMVATNTQQQDDTVSVYLSNIGIADIRIHTVLVDGLESSFVLKNQDDVPTDVFHIDELAILEIQGTGDAVQVITDSGKLFEFFVR